MFQRRMGRRENRGTASLGAPAVFCIALCAIARHSLLVVRQGCGLQPFAACSAALEQRNSLARRSGCFCIALCAIARHSLLVVRQGYGLQPFAACSAALEQRNSLARRSGCFCIALCAIARHSRAGKKKRQPSRATAAGRHAPFPVSYTIRLPAGSICARNIIPWFCPLRKYKKQG